MSESEAEGQQDASGQGLRWERPEPRGHSRMLGFKGPLGITETKPLMKSLNFYQYWVLSLWPHI